MFDEKIKNFLKKHNYEFIHKKNTPSTMDGIKKYLEINKKNCIYLSDKQTKGKGQRGKKWHSPFGNIYCSVSFDNFLEIKKHFLFSMVIALSIKMTLEKFNGDNIIFKWPNDIFHNKKKFSGIISEILNTNSVNNKVIVGFGINFISTPELKKYNATFIKAFTNIKSINEFIFIFIKYLFLNIKILKSGKTQKLFYKFSESLMKKNEIIKIVNNNNSAVISGTFRGINEDGSLILEKNLKCINIYNGSIIL